MRFVTGALGKFIHDPLANPADGLAGPVIGKGRANPIAVHGGAYAPYVVERWTKVRGSELDLYYVLFDVEPLRRRALEVAPAGRVAVVA